MMDDPQAAQYGCPGESVPISRAIHLGRLARFYPPCRQCAHRQDTGSLSARHVQRLQETAARSQVPPLFHDEGAAGVYLNDLDAAAARRLAGALGIYLRNHEDSAGEAPLAVIGGDGRPSTPEIVAAASEGLRWSGCHVVDLGPASAACLAFAVAHLDASGGILVGNPTDHAQTVGLKFWAHGGYPLSSDGPLDDVRRIYESGPARPTRRFGALRRFQADVLYLDSLSEHYHALRPLRFVFDTTCPPLLGYIAKLTRWVACQPLPCPAPPNRIPEQIQSQSAHFGVRVDDDGERLALWDEQGRRANGEQVLGLIGRHLVDRGSDTPVVLEEQTSPPCVQVMRELGVGLLVSAPRRHSMVQAMRDHKALLGGGPSGRCWYGSPWTHDSPPTADALLTLTWLLEILSQSDRPLSQVLDEAPPAG